MKKIVASLIGVLLLVPALLSAEVIDRIVAVVNDEPITLSELNRSGEDFFNQIVAATPPDKLDQAMAKARQDMLSTLINSKIAAQKAAELGVAVSDQEVDAAIADILKRNNITHEALIRELSRSGRSEDGLRRALHDQILRSRLVAHEVHAKIVITEEKIADYYQAHYGPDKSVAGYAILQMGFSWNKKGRFDSMSASDQLAAKNAARQRAEEVRAQVLAGGSFRELAQTHSDLPSAVEGGDIGTFKLDEMAPVMRETITSLNPGEISPVVEIGGSYQFFKLLSSENGTPVPLETVRAEIHDLLYQKEVERLYEKWLEDLREQAYIQRLL